jgi:hypothetical protein
MEVINFPSKRSQVQIERGYGMYTSVDFTNLVWLSCDLKSRLLLLLLNWILNLSKLYYKIQNRFKLIPNMSD